MKQRDFENEIRRGQIVAAMTFSQKVWALTARIPEGKVVTYADIAHALGTKAYRAVGNAMNHNPYAPGVPCHRVVGSDGSLTGYAHGLERKREILKAEGIECDADRIPLARLRYKFPAESR